MSTSARRKINKTRSRSVLQLYKIFKDFSSSLPILPLSPSLISLSIFFSIFLSPYNTFDKTI